MRKPEQSGSQGRHAFTAGAGILICAAGAGILLYAALWFLSGNAFPRHDDTVFPAQGTAHIPSEDSPDGGKYAALTFDDGPHPGTTDRLLDGLRVRGIRATFFLVGEEAAVNRELVLRIAAEGHQTGNHTWSHRRLEDLPEEEIAQEIGKTDALLESLLGPGDYWLRPPYGLIRTASAQRLSVPLITWSVDPRDWESRDAVKVTDAVLSAVEPGCIILLHDIYPTSVDAALRIADRLSEQGYTLLTVSELLTRYGVEARAGTIYRKAAS